MKARILLLSIVVVVGAGASLALAAPPAGKGKPTTGAGCRPQVTVVVRGTIALAPGVSGTSLSLNVTWTNAHGKAYKASEVAFAIDTKTKIRRNGAKQQAALLVGDRALVQARACKADLADGGRPALTATRIVAQPARA